MKTANINQTDNLFGKPKTDATKPEILPEVSKGPKTVHKLDSVVLYTASWSSITSSPSSLEPPDSIKTMKLIYFHLIGVRLSYKKEKEKKQRAQ